MVVSFEHRCTPIRQNILIVHCSFYQNVYCTFSNVTFTSKTWFKALESSIQLIFDNHDVDGDCMLIFLRELDCVAAAECTLKGSIFNRLTS